MNNLLIPLFLLRLICIAQTPAPRPGQMDHQTMPDMPGMDHGTIQHSASPAQVGNPLNADADLLQDLAAHPPMLLEDFQKLAQSDNPTLRQANALINHSSAQARQAGLYPNPSIGYQGEQIRGGSYQGGEEGAFVQQTIVLGGKLGLRKNIYQEQKRSDELGLSEQRIRVASDILVSFYSALAAQETVTLRKQLLSLSLDALTTAHQLANVGQADAPDVLQAEVETEQAKVDYTAAQRFYIQSFRQLSALTGKPETPLARLQGDLEHPPQLGELIIDQIVKDSPSVKRAQQNVLRARAQLNSATREAIPDLQVRAGLQQNSEPVNEAGHSVGLQAFASVGISLPLFNRNQGNIAAARAEIELAEAEVMRVQLSLRQLTEPLLQGYLSHQTQAERYKTEMIPRAQKAYELYLAKYQNMGAAYPQVLISQRTLFQLRVAYIAALDSVWMNALSLQNFGLSSGLNAPATSGTSDSSLNLPTISGGMQ